MTKRRGGTTSGEFEIRKVARGDEHYGAFGRRFVSSAEYGVFIDGHRVMRIWNESMGRRKDMASWRAEFIGDAGNTIFEVASSQSLAQAKERVPSALAAVGLIPGEVIPGWYAKFNRG